MSLKRNVSLATGLRYKGQGPMLTFVLHRIGGLGMGICGAWVYIGARSTSATNIALIYSLSPAFIVLAASFWLHERLRPLQWLGIALAFAGLVHVVIKGQWTQLLAVRFVAGDLWILACAFSSSS